MRIIPVTEQYKLLVVKKTVNYLITCISEDHVTPSQGAVRIKVAKKVTWTQKLGNKSIQMPLLGGI